MGGRKRGLGCLESHPVNIYVASLSVKYRARCWGCTKTFLSKNFAIRSVRICATVTMIQGKKC